MFGGVYFGQTCFAGVPGGGAASVTVVEQGYPFDPDGSVDVPFFPHVWEKEKNDFENDMVIQSVSMAILTLF